MSFLSNQFQHVLIISSQEVHARRDRSSLKNFKCSQIKWLATGVEAIDYLSRNSVDIVLCDSEIQDMTGIKLLNLVRKNLKLHNLPIVMVTLENHRHHVLDAIQAGCTGYVLRPYSLDTFEKHLRMAMQLTMYAEIETEQLADGKELLSEGNFDEAIDTFEEIISIQDEAQRYYDMGMKYLMQQLYGKAIISFKKAVKINNLFAEAFQGMAEAYKGKGDEKQYTRYLQKAADIYAQFDKLEETKSLFIEILKYESQTPNPFNTLGVTLRKSGDYAGAVHAYIQALKLTPEDENIHFNTAKAYYFMGDLEKAKGHIVQALDIDLDFPEAVKLYRKIVGKDYKPKHGATPQPKSQEQRPSLAMDTE